MDRVEYNAAPLQHLLCSQHKGSGCALPGCRRHCSSWLASSVQRCGRASRARTGTPERLQIVLDPERPPEHRRRSERPERRPPLRRTKCALRQKVKWRAKVLVLILDFGLSFSIIYRSGDLDLGWSMGGFPRSHMSPPGSSSLRDRPPPYVQSSNIKHLEDAAMGSPEAQGLAALSRARGADRARRRPAG